MCLVVESGCLARIFSKFKTLFPPHIIKVNFLIKVIIPSLDPNSYPFVRAKKEGKITLLFVSMEKFNGGGKNKRLYFLNNLCHFSPSTCSRFRHGGRMEILVFLVGKLQVYVIILCNFQPETSFPP